MLFDIQYFANDNAVQAIALRFYGLDFVPGHRQAMCKRGGIERWINPLA